MKSRLVFIDLLRGWATIVMIEVHVFNAFIVPAFKGLRLVETAIIAGSQDRVVCYSSHRDPCFLHQEKLRVIWT